MRKTDLLQYLFYPGLVRVMRRRWKTQNDVTNELLKVLRERFDESQEFKNELLVKIHPAWAPGKYVHNGRWHEFYTISIYSEQIR